MKYIVQKKENKVYSYLLDEAGHAAEIHVDDPADGPKLGDIYIGLVQKVVKHINAAFVELIPGFCGYLPFDEIVDPIYTMKGPGKMIQAGDQIVVQIVRDAFGQKDVSLTTKLTLQGKYAVLSLGSEGVGVSKKISPEKRNQLRESLKSSDEFANLVSRIGPCHLVLRTSVENNSAPAGTRDASDEDVKVQESSSSDGDQSLRSENEIILQPQVLREISELEAEMADIKLKAPYRSVHSNLKKQPPRWITRVHGLNAKKVEEVITDDLSLYRQMLSSGGKTALQEKPSPGNEKWGLSLTQLSRENESGNGSETGEDSSSPDKAAPEIRFRLYSDTMVSMEKVYSLNRELERALDKKVHLKCGGDLVIESTEALHIIDVNSGRLQSKKSKEDALLGVNLEAAKEAARQIRLRNLSGIIVIDFINLKMQKNSLRILEELRRSVSEDPVRTQVVDMTKLGLVELTRQKIEAPLEAAVRRSAAPEACS